MDAIQLIERDHREVERLFGAFDRAARAGDVREQARLAREITRELSVHAAIEEQVLYPALRRAGVEAERLDALEDHHAVKVLLSELDALGPRAERFAPKVRLVARSVRRHVEEEESELLPRLRQALGDDELRSMGEELARARRAAPTRPHPLAPDTPPANVVANAAAALLDRSRDALLEAAEVLRAMAEQGAWRSARAAREAASRVRTGGRAAVEQA
ncbi:MAG TPA: hemerythrin domain-containing protein, partial [Anaeromyxobacteraceae bacterium]|nr:hemerythrin domain-containing protein [Anaeromyxobacteraceae bacterium]